MSTLFALWAIIASLLVASANGAADCSKRPNMKDLKDCCKLPEPNWSSYSSQCPQLSTPTPKNLNPCAFDCLFNASNAIQNGELRMDNVRTMLSTLFNGNQDYVQAYAQSFEKCEPVIKQKVQEFRASGRVPKMPGTPACSMLATFYATCAYRTVFTTCPESAWTSSATCEDGKEYALLCEQNFGTMGRRGGGGSGGPRGGGSGGGGPNAGRGGNGGGGMGRRGSGGGGGSGSGAIHGSNQHETEHLFMYENMLNLY